jgi:membrane-bound serine protease (ClpP class)
MIPPAVRTRLLSLLLLAGLVLPAVAASGQEAGPVIVADVRGPLDQRAIDFLAGTLQTEDAQLVVFQIDNPGVASGDMASLLDAVAAAPVPVVAWVGPSGATAYGGAAQLVAAVPVAGAAPGARIGYTSPTVQRGDHEILVPDPAVLALASTTVEVSETDAPSFVDVVVPSIGQFIAGLDGTVVSTVGGPVTLETSETVTGADGVAITVPSVEVRFLKPGLLTRFLRLAVSPEAALFFLLAGLTVAVFEFYAAGVGLAAAVAALMLFLAGYGLATLPVNWWAVGALLAGLGLTTWDLQRNELGLRSIAGAVLLLTGGMWFTAAHPQFGPAWWQVLLIVAGVALFFMFAITTVIRSRFSTPTIGREHLIGRVGTAETTFDPEGVVSLQGARWRARSRRAAGIREGEEVVVLGVAGIVLEVGPADTPQDGAVRD